ncbi:hypothetical protein [Paenirhodobacter sp.]|uniref:hypothetical protein n=1 Tax=Paenirhodobacter sp. TaxID=1965326 RepID=UPI003B3FAB86
MALDAIRAASAPQSFPAITPEGRAATPTATGNPDCHVVLCGGGPNYGPAAGGMNPGGDLAFGLGPGRNHGHNAFLT